MTNTLSLPYIEGTQAAQSFRICDPRPERAARTRLFRPDIPELAHANSLWCPAGRWPVRAWVLLRRGDYVQMDPYKINYQLTFADGVRSLTFKNLAVVQARCVFRGRPQDPNSIYLIELTDGRGLLDNRWFAQGTSSSYNSRAPAYPEQFYATSLHFGSPYTWDYLVQDLWLQMASSLGAYPGLPSAPARTPEGWVFPGCSCWEALSRVLDHLGFQVVCDLTSDTPYSIVDTTAGDVVFTASQNSLVGSLEEDLDWIDTGSGRVPGRVTVYFHRRNQYYGTEETVRRDALQWTSTPDYRVTINAPAQFSSAVGMHHLWSDFTVRFDTDGVPLPADVAAAAVIAQDEATAYYGRIYRTTGGFMSQWYAGLQPFVTGSRVDGVAWRMDFETNKGWQTCVVRGPQPPFEGYLHDGH